MIGVFAAAGSSVHRFGAMKAVAEDLGGEVRELTSGAGRVRLAVLVRSSPALDFVQRGERALAAVGSGLLRIPSRPAEALLDAWDREGKAFLDGAFYDLAVVVADETRGGLTVATASGNQRLFVHEGDAGLAISSRLILLTGPEPELTVDRSYEDFLLGFGFLPDRRTPFGGVRACPGGAVRRWPEEAPPPPSSGAAGRGPAPGASPSELGGAEDARDRLYDTFLSVLDEQAGSRRSHAVLLGGLDSALVVAGLRRMGHDVDTYTFSFGDPRYEQRHARRISTELGARHHPVKITPEVIADGLARFPEHFSQPAPQPHYQLHTAHACRVIRDDGHDHVFTGDGCDSAFLGYPTVSLRADLVRRLASLPRVVRRGLLALVSRPGVERRLGHVARTARSTLQALDLPRPARGHLPTRYLDHVALERLRRGRCPSQHESVEAIRLRLAAGLDELDPVRLAFHGNGLIGQSGSKVEGSVAVSGVAQSSPYRDPRLKGFVTSLPVELLRPRGSRAGGAGKQILLDMVRERELLPEYVIDLPKQSPSDSPVDRWYQGPLRPLVFELLEGLPFDYDREYVEEILAPKWAEDVFRNRISLGHHAFQAIGLLCTYATFTRRGA